MVEVPSWVEGVMMRLVAKRVAVVTALVMVGLALPGALFAQGAKSDVQPFQEGAAITGTSGISRGSEAVSIWARTEGLAPGHVVTMWFVIFNDPSGCATSPCTGADLGNEAAEGSVIYADGAIVGGNGIAHHAGRRNYGYNGIVLFGDGLTTANAEIHIVLRTHGEQLTGAVASQMTTLNGGCAPSAGFDDSINGIAGPNVCDDIAFAIHE